jgi:hypothetical protein
MYNPKSSKSAEKENDCVHNYNLKYCKSFRPEVTIRKHIIWRQWRHHNEADTILVKNIKSFIKCIACLYACFQQTFEYTAIALYIEYL